MHLDRSPRLCGRRPDSRRAIVFMSACFLLLGSQCSRGEPASDSRPGVRAATAAVKEQELSFTNGDLELRGTLFLPEAQPAARALVLLAGSDRSARGPRRLRLARQLAAKGTAVYVYDSPGTGATRGGNARLQTREDRVREALAAVDFLRARSEIDRTRVGLMGGSEGADIALLAAARDSTLAFAVAQSAAAGVPPLDLMAYAAEKSGRGRGLSDPEIARAATFKELSYAILTGIDLLEWPLLEERVRHWNDPHWLKLIELARRRCGNLAEAEREAWLIEFRGVMDRFASEPWFASIVGAQEWARMAAMEAGTFFSLLEQSPYARDWKSRTEPELSRIRCPIFAVWGEEDAFLPPHRSAARLVRALGESRHPASIMMILPGADHFIMHKEKPGEYADDYLPALTAWLQAR